MRILLIDTSSACAEFGYAEGGIIIYSHRNCEKNSADGIAFEINKFLREAGIFPGKTDAVSISNGPGSFTGLRIGSAIAKGFCFATGCRLLQISSLDVLAGRVMHCESEFASLINSNSGSGEFYSAVYKLTDNRPERVSEYSVLTLEEVSKLNIPFVCETQVLTDTSDSLKQLEPCRTAIQSHLRLAAEMAKAGVYSDIDSAEPYYMKEFTVRK